MASLAAPPKEEAEAKVSWLSSNAAPGLDWLMDTRIFISLVRCFYQCLGMAKSTDGAKTHILPKLLFQRELRGVNLQMGGLLLRL